MISRWRAEDAEKLHHSDATDEERETTTPGVDRVESRRMRLVSSYRE